MPQDRAYAASTETDGNTRTKLIRVEFNTSVNFYRKQLNWGSSHLGYAQIDYFTPSS